MYPRPGRPLIPSVIRPFLRRTIPGEAAAEWPRLSPSELDQLLRSVLAAVDDVLRSANIALPHLTYEAIATIVARTGTRTANGLLRAIRSPSPLWPDSTAALMSIRNLGMRSALDFLTALDDAYPNGVPPSDLRAWIGEQDRESSPNPRGTRSWDLGVPDDQQQRGAGILNGRDTSLPRRMLPATPASIRGMYLGTNLLLFLSFWSSRKRAIVLARSFSRNGPPTLEALGKHYGITRERVRQIASSGIRGISQRLDRWPELGSAILELRTSLGEMATWQDALRRVRACFPLPSDLELPAEAARISLWLADFSEFDDELLYRRSREVQRETAADMVLQAELDGLTPNAAVRLIAANLRLSADTVTAIAAERREAISNREAARPLSDRLKEALIDAGHPMHIAELLRAVDPRGQRRRYAENILTTNTSLFCRVGRSRFGLASWQLERYTSIADAIDERLIARGGRVLLTELVAELPRTFGVSPASVRSYATSHQFVSDPLGFVRRRSSEVAYPTRTSAVERCRSLFYLDDRWYLRVAVTRDVLRGSGLICPTPLVSVIGLNFAQTLSFRANSFDLSFRWNQPQPSLSSVRMLVKSLGGRLNDLLFIELPEDGRSVGAFLVEEHASENRSALQTLANECGCPADSDGVAIENIASALRLARPEGATLTDIRSAFSYRNDRDALRRLPDIGRTRLEVDPLDDLSNLLG